MTQITDIPHDSILRVFELLLPTSPPRPVKPSGVREFLATTSPYNVEKVCRSWREAAQSTGKLWTSLLLTFRGLDKCAMKCLIDLVQKHLRLSKNMVLTCSIHLQGEPQAFAWKEIIDALSEHQHRWRSMSFWFEDFKPEKRFKTQLIEWDDLYYQHYQRKNFLHQTVRLDARHLALLEELRVSHSPAFLFNCTRSNPLSSLKRLYIGTRSTRREQREVFRWLELAPKLEELTVKVSGQFYVDYDLDKSTREPPIRRTGIRSLRLLCDAVGRDDSVSTFVLPNILAPSLTYLEIGLQRVSCANALHDFLRRSKLTALETFHLTFEPRPTRRVEDAAFTALELVPSVKNFVIQSESITCLDALEPFFLEVPQGAKSAYVVFPGLETLEIVGAISPPQDFERVFMSRGPRLSRIKLAGCRFKLEGGVDDGWNSDDEEESSRRIPLFERGADSSTLPSEFEDLKPLMSKGLEFEVTDEVNKDLWL